MPANRNPGQYPEPVTLQPIVAPAPDPMAWLILECILALLLFVFIVWWTLPRRRDEADKPGDDSG